MEGRRGVNSKEYENIWGWNYRGWFVYEYKEELPGQQTLMMPYDL